MYDARELYTYMEKKGYSHAEVSKQLTDGIKIEMEHTSDPKIAKVIAMDHIVEFGTYYTALKEMEAKLKESDK